MIDHTGFGSPDFLRARAFYDAVFAALGGGCLHTVPTDLSGGERVVGYGRETPTFWLNEGDAPAPALHVAFTAQTRGQVEAFHAAALAAGGRDNGAPGLRPHYHAHYYAAFVLDPDGNNIEAVCHAEA